MVHCELLCAFLLSFPLPPSALNDHIANNKLVKTTLNVKTRPAAEEFVPCTRSVLFLVGCLEGVLGLILLESRIKEREDVILIIIQTYHGVINY